LPIDDTSVSAGLPYPMPPRTRDRAILGKILKRGNRYHHGAIEPL
jgi:hypothetical protein